MKLKKTAKKSLGMFLVVALMVSGIVIDNGTVLEVKAAGAPSVTAFATRKQLMNSFDLDGTNDTVGKVQFGTNNPGTAGAGPQTWYIAGGEDHDGDDTKDSIVLLCDPLKPMKTGVKFENSTGEKTYSEGDDWGTYETALTTSNTVYANHYGASGLRTELKGMVKETNTDYFTTAEQAMMQATRVYTSDKKNGNTYHTEDVLYAAYGNDQDKYITVGTNSANSLNSGLKVSLTSAPYNSGRVFWLRALYDNNDVTVQNP